MSETTINKYLEVMRIMYKLVCFSPKRMCKKHRVSNGLMTRLVTHGYIAKLKKLSKWVGDEPTIALARMVYNEQAEAIANPKGLQKRAAVPAPIQLETQPVSALPPTSPPVAVAAPAASNGCNLKDAIKICKAAGMKVMKPDWVEL